jgi:3,4-dehydroadipyl-CoA semialdehyde dehydrogenase
MQTLSSHLVGAWVTGAAPFQVLENATTGDAFAQASSNGLDLAAALRFARDVGGPSLRAMTFAQRGELLLALSRVVHELRDALIDASRESYGATRGDAKFDVDGGAGTLAHYAALGQTLGARTWTVDGEPEKLFRTGRLAGMHVLLPRRGVAVHINAFNFPIWGLCEKLAVAILAGVPVLSKPATATAPAAVRLVEAWVERSILPPGALSLLVGSAGDLLDHLGPQDAVAFTGGSDTARTIRANANLIRHNVPVNVEADSLNAAVLGPDVEVGSLTWDGFISDLTRDLTQKAGQKCTATRRIFVPTDKLDDLRDTLADRLADAAVGDPDARDTRVGPLATRAQQRDIQAGIDRFAAAYETFALGKPAPEPGFFVQPRVFLATREGPAHDHEIFGPVATVIPYDGSATAAIALVERGGGSLVTSVYADDRAWAREVVFGIAPFTGRVYWGSVKVADVLVGPGTVLPSLVHGGPGKAGGGEELGGLRGLRFYQQRTAIQGDHALLSAWID